VLWCSQAAKHPKAQRNPAASIAAAPVKLTRRGTPLTESVVLHFHNTPGASVIEIGAREFMCIGELPPFDHPHVFLDMGDAAEIICPYCSTLFRYDPTLGPGGARPPECMLPDDAIA
jgi:uncharacterized Zn-finger protein